MALNSMAKFIISGYRICIMVGLCGLACMQRNEGFGGFVPFKGNDSVPDFYLKKTEVSNADYLKFVQATGYTTCAELGLDSLGRGSFRFNPDSGRFCFESGLSWRHPEKEDLQPANWGELPVVHLCLEDMKAYASWAEERLPCVREWRVAAEKNRNQSEKQIPHGNTWQGLFPIRDLGEDGFTYRLSPVGTFESINGTFDLIGNAWEATTDHCMDGYLAVGGSYLCAPNWCRGYLIESPTCIPQGVPYGHVGFRTAKSAKSSQ